MSDVTLEKLAARVDVLRRMAILSAALQQKTGFYADMLESDAKSQPNDTAYVREIGFMAQDLREYANKVDAVALESPLLQP